MLTVYLWMFRLMTDSNAIPVPPIILQYSTKAKQLKDLRLVGKLKVGLLELHIF